jgi:farnesol kinase
MTPEARRQLVHLSVLLFAVPVPFLGADWAAVMAGLAVFINWVVFPLTGRDRELMRDGEKFLNGIRFYPVAVLAAILLLPLHLAQAAWAVLAVGDAFSNLIGRRYGRVKLPWNRAKSYAGTLGFVATAFPAALGFLLYTQHFAAGDAFLAAWRDSGLAAPLPLGSALAVAFLGSAVAAILESLPLRIDDNLSVTIGSGAVMAACLPLVLR